MRGDAMPDDFEELNSILKSAAHLDKKRRVRRLEAMIARSNEPSTSSSSDSEKIDVGGLCQFTTNDNTQFFPASRTKKILPPAVYDIRCCSMKGIYFQKLPVKTDGLLRFPETNSEKVIEEIKKFWTREAAFKDFGLNYQRGVILWGPAGSGKSCTVKLVMQDVVERQGVVFKFRDPDLFSEGIRIFREIQPDTGMVVLMEDIDSIIENHSESQVLNILDGVDQIEKVVYLATTNYPERLGARILNRPSRFDKRFKMGHPKKASRKLYFEHLISEKTRDEYHIDLDKWVDDTENMSIAHLKELFVSVCILGNNYEEAIETLRSMVEEHPDSKEDAESGFGFKAK
jgi:SpoVK/Ycf46/Vps4 family AAA+-type ATPase